jgi:hypothetical protein
MCTYSYCTLLVCGTLSLATRVQPLRSSQRCVFEWYALDFRFFQVKHKWPSEESPSGGDRLGSKRGRSPLMEAQGAVVELREIFGVRGHGPELDACVKTRKTEYSAIPV